MKKLTISKGGQVSVPAAVRHRWQTKTVIAEDEGDRLILKPAPDDPIAAAFGAFKDQIKQSGVSTEEARRQLREDEVQIEKRKFERYYGPGK